MPGASPRRAAPAAEGRSGGNGLARPPRPQPARGRRPGARERAGRGGSPSRDGAAPREEGGGGSTFLLPPELFPLVAGVHGAVAGGGFQLQVPQAHGGGVGDAEPQRQPPRARCSPAPRPPAARLRAAPVSWVTPRSNPTPPQRPPPSPPPVGSGSRRSAAPSSARRRRPGHGATGRGPEAAAGREEGLGPGWGRGAPSAASAWVRQRRPRRGRWGPARHHTAAPGRSGARSASGLPGGTERSAPPAGGPRCYATASRSRPRGGGGGTAACGTRGGTARPRLRGEPGGLAGRGGAARSRLLSLD